MSTFPLDGLKKTLQGRSLYLVGMMGSGKSATGPLLAKQLGYGFVDSDAVIEQLRGLTISKIFEIDGEKSFREIESQVLQGIGERHSLVVSTGGGIVTKPENWGILHQGIVIWIDPERKVLLSRLFADLAKRPLLKNKDEAFIDALCLERERFYIEADLHIRVGDESVEFVTQKILNDLSKILISPEGQAEQQTTAR
tara:strand:- start:272 stop:862 length:591 start_codon:yes stop_codon:yes gene_type:complete